MRSARRRALRSLAALTLVLAASPAAALAREAELALSVAISMKDAVEEIGRRFRGRHAGVALRYNYGASGELARQIEAGAPVDVFVSAGEAQMDDLERRGLLAAGTRRAFARNALVVIAPVEARVDLTRPDDLLDSRVSRVVIGNPKTVPAGQYAEQSLRALGLLDRLRPKLVLAENVRQALDYVARGEVDAGWVYATDVVARGGRVRVAFRPPEDTYRPIVYPAAVVRETRRPALARAFVETLVAPDSAAVLARFGFLPPAGAR